ncbi:Retrovirus-related Pol polyprotein from transposon TNT 1-94 [Gossypium australe]|uniref:Retrovirus-related Pol polyprotein from transposon TNT 1-94 n=1 Tax=Gossypium australe TaxID=47621 RepID=A0A5B6URH2_9ROSI|nr:Retrovirus-related Pol polyprotein from transposon TNT 1-94 [Gossypium australe]
MGFSSTTAGLDYHETFSPVVKANTVHLILVLALSRKWKLRQVDVNNVFLNGDLAEDIYRKQPTGFEVVDDHGQPLACKLNKATYGLKQAPRAWFEKLRNFLVQQLNFKPSTAYSSLFYKHTNAGSVYFLVFIDDIIVTCGDCAELDAFSFKDLGELSFFLGLKVLRHPDRMHVSQQKYARELLKVLT